MHIPFKLGQVVMTPSAAEAVGPIEMLTLLARHVAGDWGVVDDEDQVTNDEAVRLGNRILSAYPVDPALPCKGFGDNCVWIITEADRSVTTILLPDEY